MNLKVDQLSKAYGETPVIEGFSFEMVPGERVALTGKSGTGKTTFMRIINNLEKADQGTVRIGDSYLFKDSGNGAVYSSSNEQRQYQNSMGMVFQNYALFPNFDILENLLEAPLAQKLDDEETLRMKALDLLSKMGIEDQADKMPHQLSGGQQQRAAVARALMLEPAYLCLDEPTSALDRESADSIGRLLEDLSQEGMGVLIVTHDLPFAEAFSTRTISSQAFLRKEVVNG